jgi:glycosyltransferase involved in cell wall biosynthesis
MTQTINKIDVPVFTFDQATNTQLPITNSSSSAIIKRLSIIIPVYNEGKTITLLLDRINAVKLIRNIEKEVIIVNDCSTDNTEVVINDYIENIKNTTRSYFKYTRHEVNQGKGAAIHTGIAMATGEYLLVQDADLEYDPGEYNTLLRPIVMGSADIVYGSRFMGGNPHRILFFWHSIGNKFLTYLSNMFTNLNLTDMNTCYKLFRSDILKTIPLQEKRFGFDPEVTVKVSKIPHIKIYEVGISYYGRTFAEGKKIGWRDGFRSIYCTIWYSLFSSTTSQKQDTKLSIPH